MTGKSGVVFEEQQPTEKHEKHIFENTSQTKAGQSGREMIFLRRCIHCCPSFLLTNLAMKNMCIYI
jgi:hypothetical protein